MTFLRLTVHGLEFVEYDFNFYYMHKCDAQFQLFFRNAPWTASNFQYDL
jgi:hypothetical protein